MGRGKSLATLGATTLQHGTTILGCHSRAETMFFGATTVVRLIGSFRHNYLNPLAKVKR